MESYNTLSKEKSTLKTDIIIVNIDKSIQFESELPTFEAIAGRVEH